MKTELEPLIYDTDYYGIYAVYYDGGWFLESDNGCQDPIDHRPTAADIAQYAADCQF